MRSAGRSVFLSSAWLRAWADHFGRPGDRLEFLQVRHDGVLVGGFPLVRRGRLLRRLEVVGGGPPCPDHLEPVAEAGADGAVADAVFGEIRGGLASDVIMLDGLASGATFTRRLVEHARRSGGTVTSTPCPYVELPGSFDAYLARRRAKSRSHIRRAHRRLDELGARFDLVVDRDDVAPTMRRLIELHLASRAGSGRRTTFADPAMQSFLVDMAIGVFDRGQLLLHRLRTDDQVIAALCCFSTPTSVQYYCGGYDPEFSALSPGDLVLLRAIEVAIASGVGTFDLLRGDETYKNRLTSLSTHDVRVIVPSSHRGRAYGPAVSLARSLRNVKRSADARLESVSSSRASAGRASGPTSPADADRSGRA